MMPDPQKGHRRFARYWGKQTLADIHGALKPGRINEMYVSMVKVDAQRAAHWAALSLDCPTEWVRPGGEKTD